MEKNAGSARLKPSRSSESSCYISLSNSSTSSNRHVFFSLSDRPQYNPFIGKMTNSCDSCILARVKGSSSSPLSGFNWYHFVYSYHGGPFNVGWRRKEGVFLEIWLLSFVSLRRWSVIYALLKRGFWEWKSFWGIQFPSVCMRCWCFEWKCGLLSCNEQIRRVGYVWMIIRTFLMVGTWYSCDMYSFGRFLFDVFLKGHSFEWK